MEEPVIEPGSLDKGQSRSCPGLIRALYSKTPIGGGRWENGSMEMVLRLNPAGQF